MTYVQLGPSYQRLSSSGLAVNVSNRASCEDLDIQLSGGSCGLGEVGSVVEWLMFFLQFQFMQVLQGSVMLDQPQGRSTFIGSR